MVPLPLAVILLGIGTAHQCCLSCLAQKEYRIMRIAQVAPLSQRVAPDVCSTAERAIARLTDDLVERGHDVTLFASGDSETRAQVESVVEVALGCDPEGRDSAVYEARQYQRVAAMADQFDLVHFHTGPTALASAARLLVPSVHTLRNQATLGDRRLLAEHLQQSQTQRAETQPYASQHSASPHSVPQPYFVSTSEALRRSLPSLNWIRTVPDGIDLETWAYQESPDPETPYLAFVGRMCPETGPDRAIEIALAAGWKIKLAGRLDPEHWEFFDTQVGPHFDGDWVDYWGDVDCEMAAQLLGGAAAVLSPLMAPACAEVALIEAASVGTPVITMRQGSVMESVVQGRTGFICDSVEEMIAAVPQAASLDRRICRELAARYFGDRRMTDAYEVVYRKILVAMGTASPIAA
jgi:glycosyltransferase involved in cell wall biosynthesis